jgi:ubiquinone/menaquinone biosynthesis C-methylase UbiE
VKNTLNRITNDYIKEQSGCFSEKFRVNWICEQAKGENILDIGCSIGDSSILLAREGKKVLGIDISDESVAFALEQLNQEVTSTKEYAEFNAGNFMTMDLTDKTFDCILFGNVLNHVSDSQRFMDKALRLLSDNGLIIITVPFGVNNFFNYKRTYYLRELLNFQRNNLVLKDIKMSDEWVGAIYKKSKDVDRVNLDHKLLSQLENSFESVERKYLNIINEFTILENEKEQMQQSNIELKNEVADLKYRLERLNSVKETYIPHPGIESIKEVEKALENQKKASVESVKKNIALEEQLLTSIKSEEKTLLSYKKLLRKYNALSNSKLGKFTLYYWKKRRSVFGGK